MKAIRIHEHGGPEVLRHEDCPEPTLRPGHVCVRMRAASINHLDLWVRRGMPGVTIPLPHVPGCDGAGVVEAVGEGVDDLAPGTRVLVQPGISSGHAREDLAGFDNLARDYGILGEDAPGVDAELVVLPRRNVLEIPEAMPFEEAAALPLTFVTAWGMLVDKCGVKPGDDVLVLGAGSGVGSTAVQIAKLHGARVFTTVGRADKRERALALGADHVLDHSSGSFANEVRALTGGRGVDIVVEHVGQATFAQSMRSLAKGGKLVTCGATTGPKIELNLLHVFMKHQQILGSTMGPKSCLFTALKLWEEGRFRPVVDRTFPLAEVAEAHRVVERREQFGKVVLTF